MSEKIERRKILIQADQLRQELNNLVQAMKDYEAIHRPDEIAGTQGVMPATRAFFLQSQKKTIDARIAEAIGGIVASIFPDNPAPNTDVDQTSTTVNTTSEAQTSTANELEEPLFPSKDPRTNQRIP